LKLPNGSPDDDDDDDDDDDVKSPNGSLDTDAVVVVAFIDLSPGGGANKPPFLSPGGGANKPLPLLVLIFFSFF